MKLPWISVSLTQDNVPEVTKAVIEQLRPQWNKDTVVHKRNNEGFVNVTIIVSRDGKDMSDAIVMRTLSETFGGPVSQQQHVLKFLRANHLGPAVLAFIENGVVMEFLKPKILKWTDWVRLSDPQVWKPIARALAHWHQQSLYEKALEAGVHEQKYLLWGPIVANEWDRLIALPAMDPYRHWLPDAATLLAEERSVIESLLRTGDVDKRFCHLDVNVSNVALDEEKGESTLFDFDYASISYIQVDLSWYFHIYMDIDNASLDQYPSEEYRRAFITEYLNHRHRLDGKGEASQNDINKLLIQVEKMRLINYLRSVVDGPTMLYTTSNNKETSDFDGFMPLSETAWKTFNESKERILAMKSS